MVSKELPNDQKEAFMSKVMESRKILSPNAKDVDTTNPILRKAEKAAEAAEERLRSSKDNISNLGRHLQADVVRHDQLQETLQWRQEAVSKVLTEQIHICQSKLQEDAGSNAAEKVSRAQLKACPVNDQRKLWKYLNKKFGNSDGDDDRMLESGEDSEEEKEEEPLEVDEEEKVEAASSLPPTSFRQTGTHVPDSPAPEADTGRSSRSRNRSRSPTALPDLITQATSRKSGNEVGADGTY